MESFLKNLINNQYEYQEIIQTMISSFFYRKKRYDNEFSLVLIYIKDNNYKYDFEKIIRKTDKYIQLNSEFYCLILDGVSSQVYIKAAENVQYALQKEHKNISYITTVNSEQHFLDAKSIINRLFEILVYAIKNDINNLVVDNTLIREF